MIKSYDFPNIFQNVVGETVPSYIQYKKDKPKHTDKMINVDVQTFQKLRITEKQNQNKKEQRIFGIKSKPKVLQIRSKDKAVTSNIIGIIRDTIDQKKSLLSYQTKFTNYLKRKKPNNGQITDQNLINDDQQNSYEFMSSNIADQNYDQQAKFDFQRKKMRLRTSVENETIINQNQYFNDFSSRFKTENKTDHIKILKQFNQGAEQLLNINSKINSKADILKLQSNKASKRDLSKRNISKQDITYRKKMQKKTVNFLVNDQIPLYSKKNNDSIRKGSKKTTIMKQGRHLKQSSSSSSSDTSEQSKKQKSHISINLSSAKSIKSNRTISEKQRNYQNGNKVNFKMYYSKERFGTKTAKIIPTTIAKYDSHKKKYKSEAQIDSELEINNSKIKSSNPKSLNFISKHQIKVKSKVKMKQKNSQKAINQLNRRQSSLRSSNNFIVKNSKHNATIKALYFKPNWQTGNAFNQLNNFHQYLEDIETDECYQQQKTIGNGPIVIASDANYNFNCGNSSQFLKQTLMLNLSFKVVKRMNKLLQKNV